MQSLHPLHIPTATTSTRPHYSTASPSLPRRSPYARGTPRDPSSATPLSDQPPFPTHRCPRPRHRRKGHRRHPPLCPRRNRATQKCDRGTGTTMTMTRWIGRRPRPLCGPSWPHAALCPRGKQRTRRRAWRRCLSGRISSTHQSRVCLRGTGEGEGGQGARRHGHGVGCTRFRWFPWPV